MTATSPPTTQLEVHDRETLRSAAQVLAACRGAREMAQEVVAAIERNRARFRYATRARCGCVIRARLLARSETTLTRRRLPRWLARRAHRPVPDVRR